MSGEYIELERQNRSLSSIRYSEAEVPVESPDNVEMGGKIAHIRLVIEPTWKKIVRYILYLCTGGLLWLFAYWIPSLKFALSFDDGSITYCEKIVVHGADKNIEVVEMIREKTTKKTLKVFYYRLFKYYYDDNTKTFKPC